MNSAEKIKELHRKLDLASRFQKQSNYLQVEGDYILELYNIKNISKIIENAMRDRTLPSRTIAYYLFIGQLADSIRGLREKRMNRPEELKKMFAESPLMPKDKDMRKEILRAMLDTLEEMRIEDNGKREKGLPVISQEDIEGIRDDDMFHDLYLLHEKVIKELRKRTDNSLSFQSKPSTLNINDFSVLISKSANSKPHYLLKTLFKKTRKRWCYDEVAEDWGREDYTKDDSNKFYQTAKVTNDIIAKKTPIKDFLIYDSKTVRINEKYLP